MKKQSFEDSFEYIGENIVTEFAEAETSGKTGKKAFARFASRPVFAAACAVFALAFVVAGVMLFGTPNALPHENSAPDQSHSSEPASEPQEESKTESDTGVTDPGEASSEEDAEIGQIHEQSGPEPQQSNVRFLTAKTFSSDRAASEVGEAFKDRYASFAVELLQKCSKGGNTLLSPLSIYTVLTMLADGAKGATAEELRSVLGGPLGTGEIDQELFSYCESLESTGDATLRSANAIWLTDDEHLMINDEYIEHVNNTFCADIARAPLMEQTTVDAINAWCSENTDGMIPKILENSGDGVPTMILVNALAFDALWNMPIDPSMVKDASFHGKNGDTAVKMMYSPEYNGYICGGHETGFIKYYPGYAFVALLPEEGMSIEDYIASLDGEKLLRLFKSRGGEVNAVLPEFSCDWEKPIAGILKGMGLENAFDVAAADYSGIGVFGEIRDEDGNTYTPALGVGSVYHKTHIDVDPTGTRAASATVGAMDGIPELYEDAPTIVLDRPFVYAIVDTQNLLPIFIGCVTDIG